MRPYMKAAGRTLRRSGRPTEQSDDVGMVEVFHTGCLIQELFNLPLGEAVHWRSRGNLLLLQR